MTTALRSRRSLAGAALASVICAGVTAGPAQAAEPTDVPSGSGDHTLDEPSRVMSTATGAALTWPLDGRLTSTFGPRWGRQHRGIDVAAPTGTPIRAARDGRVRFAGWQGGYGYTVEIAHGDGLVTRSAHQSELHVRRGARVRREQRIGAVGSTGSSTGPHLHFEVIVRGVERDPLLVLPGRR